VTRYTQLSHNKNIQRNSDAARDLKRYRHTTAWKSEDDDIIAAGVMRQFLGELPTSIRTIQKYF